MHPFCFTQRDAHVFDEMFDKETRLKIPVNDARPEVVQRPARRSAAAHRLQHGLEIEPRFVAVKQGLAHADHVAGFLLEHFIKDMGIALSEAERIRIVASWVGPGQATL